MHPEERKAQHKVCQLNGIHSTSVSCYRPFSTSCHFWCRILAIHQKLNYVNKVVRARWQCKQTRYEDRNLNTSRLIHNVRHFPDDIFRWNFVTENAWLMFHWRMLVGIQLMIFQHPDMHGAKPLSEPMVVSLLTHICVTRAQWVIDNCLAR